MHFWHFHARLGKIKYVMTGTNIINAFLAFHALLGKIKNVMKDTYTRNVFLAFSCPVRKNKVRYDRH